MLDTPRIPVITPEPKPFDEPDLTSAPTPMKRQGGRPKAESTYDKTIQLRLSKEQLERITQLAEQAKCTRSAVIRAGLDQVHLMGYTQTLAQHKQHRELVELVSNLKLLIQLMHTNKGVVDEAQQAVKQVRLLLEQMTKERT